MAGTSTPNKLVGLPVEDALEEILDAMDAETGTVHVIGADGLLHLVHHRGGIPEALMPAIRQIPVGKGMAGLAAERGEPVQICNLQTDSSGDARPGARATGMRGSICVPMNARAGWWACSASRCRERANSPTRRPTGFPGRVRPSPAPSSRSHADTAHQP